MKIAVVTSSYGLDIPYPNEFIYESADYFLFTNSEYYISDNNEKLNIIHSPIYTISNRFKNRRAAKVFKIIPEYFIPNYDVYIWHDITHALKQDPKQLVKKYLKENDYAIFQHEFRDCLFEEAKFVKKLAYDDKKLVSRQISNYRSLKHPNNSGLYELSSYIKNNNDKTKEFSIKWFEQISKFSSRDQISFAFLIYNLKMKYSLLPGFVNGKDKNEIFKQVFFSDHPRTE
tara:strand:+ start:7346 stop:8035 length:690 start_codon:yes stop_codon:yes gene_type:complete